MSFARDCAVAVKVTVCASPTQVPVLSETEYVPFSVLRRPGPYCEVPEAVDVITTFVIAYPFSAVNEIVYAHWKIARKIKLLLPLGWLFFGGRYIIRSLTGKRPEIRLKNVMNEAHERQKFYDDLELFKNG
jgi:hypothetical protein